VAKLTYTRWTTSKRSLIAVGGVSEEYSHYCPLMDFKFIAHMMADWLEKSGSIDSVKFAKSLDGTMLPSGRVFTIGGHSYKLSVILYVLESVGMVFIEHPGSGRRRTRIDLKARPNQIRRVIDEIVSKSIQPRPRRI